MAFHRTDHNETRVQQIGKPDDNEVGGEKRGERSNFPIGLLHLQVMNVTMIMLIVEDEDMFKNKFR